MGNSRIASIGSNIMTQSAGIDVVKRQEEAAEVMFADVIAMNNIATDVDDFASDVADETLSTIETNSSDTRREKPVDAYEKYQYKDKTIRAESSENRPEQLQEAVEELDEFEEAVTEVIAEELHVSKEELEAAMEELGLTYLDLLDNKNLASLVAKLTGSENLNQLLCSEAFTNVLQQVNELGTELLSEVQMSVEELAEIQDLLEKSLTTEHDVEAELSEVPEADVPLEEVSEDETQKVEVVRVDDTEEEQMNHSEDSSDGAKQELPDMANKQSTQVQTTQVNETIVVDSTQQSTFAEQLNSVETVQTLPPHVAVADILEQFAEQARVLISVDTTKMEMQLNPEHLGKLYVEVTEQEGSITAKIQTQNAIVKEALEMQIADLKVNLSQAGVKVDSVEVTVASHEFERNLEQDANSQKQQEDAQTKATKHRNINLNELDALSGLMTEEETLVAKMMAEQGNSVDFIA